MDEVWERAIETALDGQADPSAVRSLTLDGAVKCLHGRLPPPGLLENFWNLEHLSIANVGVSSLEKFPRLPNLQRLILSDNRIAGGLGFLVEAGLASLRDLDLSNNRIQFVEDLAPLARLRLVSLDLYECPVTRAAGYRSSVFGLIRSLKYLDKMDADENERPESSDEDEDEDDEDDEEEEEEEDPGSGEIDGEDRSGKLANGSGLAAEGVVDVDEDEESDADEEAAEVARGRPIAQVNGFRAVAVASAVGEEDGDEEEDEEDGDLDEEEADEEDAVADEEDAVIEIHRVLDSEEEEEDGIEEDEEDEDDEDDEEEDEEEVEDEEEEDAEPESTGRLTNTDATEGEIDGHEQGEEDDENGEIGEEDEQMDGEIGEYAEDDGEAEDEEEGIGSEYLVQPIRGQAEAGGSGDIDLGDDDDDVEDEVEDEEDPREGEVQQPSASQLKRKRDAGNDGDSVENVKSSKH